MEILARFDHQPVDETLRRAACELVGEHSYQSGAFVGKVNVRCWRSTQREDRGGIVIELTSDSNACGFVPYAVNTQAGVQLHLAGDEESQKLLLALAWAIKTLKRGD